jgi:menaquinone-specific isochorismate synthase
MKVVRRSARSIELDEALDLVSFLPPHGFAWLLEHEGFVAWGEAERFDPGTGTDRFRRAAEMLDEAFARIDIDGVEGARAPLAFGSFTFDPETPGSALVIPNVVIEARGGRAWATIIDGELPDLQPRFARSQPSFERVRYSGSSLSEVAWLDAVARATEAIANGDLEKVVLARDVNVWSEAPFDLPAIVARLALRFPGCFTFLADGFLGASPERLIQRDGTTIRSTVLAGSAPRGGTDSDDAGKGEELLASAKDATEHELAVASVREVLGPLCEKLNADGPHLLRLANVQHLATDFIGTLRAEDSALEIAGALHPTAAVGGVPRDDALRFIQEVEGLDRARYSGPVGWVNAAGDGEWAIALRCAELDGTRGRLFAGAGVVEGSLPEAELEETRLKLRAMESVLGDG